MSHRSWAQQLNAMIPTYKRMALVGVGNELRGDDAVGVEIVQGLQDTLPATDTVLLCVAGSAPENFTGVIRRFAPDLILLIDAVQMDASPGTVRLLTMGEIENTPPSTHTLPLTLFARYLTHELPCTTVLLGIQPLDLSLAPGTPLSEPVATVRTDVLRTLQDWLRLACCASL